MRAETDDGQLLELAHRVVQEAEGLGADEAAAAVSQSTNISLTRREGRVEQATESTSRGMVVSLMVDAKYSSHSTSDFRPEALSAFLKRAVAATHYLEPDPDRAQADPALCGRGVSQEALDQDDPSWADRTPDERAKDALALEEAVGAVIDDDVISNAVFTTDGSARVGRVMSNGFADTNRGGWFAAGGEMTLRDGERRPEASAYYAARHLTDLPTPAVIAAEIRERAQERVGATSVASGQYPLILLNRATGRILGALGGPLSGSTIHEGRSCLADRLNTSVGSDLLTIIDDPTIPRGLGSRPWDGDSIASKPITIIEKGVLKSFYHGVYYARKLGVAPTTGSRSNWTIPAGDKSWRELAAQYPKAILVNSFLGGNSNTVTGDFSFGIRGLLLENGEPTQALSEMNVTGNVLEIFRRLVAVANDTWTWSAVRSPTLVFEDVQFSGK